MFDRYTKVILTIIAVSLMISTAQQFVGSADAQQGQNCSSTHPCPVYLVRLNGDYEWVKCTQNEACFGVNTPR